MFFLVYFVFLCFQWHITWDEPLSRLGCWGTLRPTQHNGSCHCLISDSRLHFANTFPWKKGIIYLHSTVFPASFLCFPRQPTCLFWLISQTDDFSCTFVLLPVIAGAACISEVITESQHDPLHGAFRRHKNHFVEDIELELFCSFACSKSTGNKLTMMMGKSKR